MENFLTQFLNSGTIVSLDQTHLLIGWGKRTWIKHPKTSNSPLFYFPDFFLSHPTPWFKNEHWMEIEINQLLSFLTLPDTSFTPINWKHTSKEEFRKAFLDLLSLIQAGTLKKAVPYAFSSAFQTMTPQRLQNSLKHLLNIAKNYPLHVYGFWEHGEGILGASPELLFEYKKEGETIHLETVACAGTCSHHEENETFFNDLKENHEHQLVIEGIMASLQPYGHVKLGERRLLKLPKLCHLVTSIQAMCHSVSFETLVEALHPTPALGVFPKKEGKKWLKEYETHVARGRYGAPAGFILPGDVQARCFVAIRNIQWNLQELFIGAGCGVVERSQFDKEWQEICLKTESIKDLLGFNPQA